MLDILLPSGLSDSLSKFSVADEINNVEINDESKEDTIKFLETLEEDEDVQNVYTNLKY